MDDIVNSLFKADALTKSNLDRGDLAIYSIGPSQEIIGSINKDTGSITPSSGNFFNRDLNPYYREYERQQGSQDSITGDDDRVMPIASGLQMVPQPISPFDFGSTQYDSAISGGLSGSLGQDSLSPYSPFSIDPAVDFTRDFGSFTLSPQTATDVYAPQYLAPVSDLAEGEREMLSEVLGSPLGSTLGTSSIDTTPTPLESAQAIINSLSK